MKGVKENVRASRHTHVACMHVYACKQVRVHVRVCVCAYVVAVLYARKRLPKNPRKRMRARMGKPLEGIR